MAFGLPPPWDPGYALPDNVRDEGLRKRGFVTKQMPRGTYDQPEVGTGGYVVPQYVMDEGYGQGTFTTKWEPRGEYDGGKIPYWLNKRPVLLADKRRAGGGRALTFAAPVTVQPYGQGSAVAMSGTPQAQLPKPLQQFGAQAAAKIIAQVAALPPRERSRALRDILNKIDRTLWKRTQDIAKELARQGATPGQAFRAALARALSAGLGAEIIRAGETSVAPQSNSLLGLGCTRARSGAKGATRDGGYVLGDDAPAAIYTGPGVTKTPLTFKVNTTVSGRTLPAGSSMAPVGCPGFSWVTDHWERTKVGQPDLPAPIGSFLKPCPVVVDQRTGNGKKMQIGPFVYAADVSEPQVVTIWNAAQVPADWKPALRAALMRPEGDRWMAAPTEWIITKAPVKSADRKQLLQAGEARQLTPQEMSSWKDWCYWLRAIGVDCATIQWNQAAQSGQAPKMFLGPAEVNRPIVPWPINQVTTGASFARSAIAPGADAPLTWKDMESVAPVAGFIHPVTGEPWGFFLAFVPEKFGTGITQQVGLQVYAAKIPQKPWYESVIDALNWFPAKLIDAVTDAVIGVAGLACDIICSTLGPAVGAAAATAAGAPPAAGAAGVSLAQLTACGCQMPGGAPLPPAPSTFPWLPVAIGGGALVAILMLSNSKKAT